MERKQACHLEWGLLQLGGQSPIMIGAAIGASQLMWVACRTSRCLVHVFQDAHLISTWRFPSSPVFLLFGPASRGQRPAPDSESEGAHTSSSCKISEASLLVFTSDGRIWHLELTDHGPPPNERPTKKRKEANPSLPQVVGNESDGMPSFEQKSWRKHGNAHSAEPHVFSSQLFKLDMESPQGGASAELRAQNVCEVSRDGNCGTSKRSAGSPGCLELGGLKFNWERITVHTQTRSSRKPEVKLVPATAFLGLAPAVSVAALGPNDTVAILCPAGGLSIMQLGFSHPSRKTLVTSVGDFGETSSKDPTCILFVSLKLHGDTLAPSGNVALVDKTLFETLFDGVGTTTSGFGLLRGDRSGNVCAISMRPSKAGVECSSCKVLCNLAQPVVAILVIPSDKASGPKQKQTGLRGPSKAEDLYGDSIMILGQVGRITLITGVKEESSEKENGPFLPASSSFSWRAKDKTSTAAQLAGKGFTFHEWDLRSPITSACMLGPFRLCYCSGSEVLYVDLFEILAKSTSHLDSNVSRPTMFSSLKPALNEKLPHSTAPGLLRVVKEELLPHIVPVADVVVAVVGRGISGNSGGSRPLIALTARGRLLGVEVSDHVSSPASRNEINVPASWRSLKAQRERQVKDSLEAVATETTFTEGIKSHNSSINLALKELATAFPLVYDICSDQKRRTVSCPDLSLTREAPRGKLGCFLTVTLPPSVLISPQELSFGPSVFKAPSRHGSNPYLVKISVGLHNHTKISLSRYWSLLLRLQNLYSDSTCVVTYSTAINKGLGLPPGAHFRHEFLVELTSTGVGPLLASVFLCHLHDPHQSVVDFKPPPCALGRVLPRNQAIETKSKASCNWTVADEETLETSFRNDTSTMAASGSVCFLLSNYRIDLLSLLQPPPLSESSPWTVPQTVDNARQVEADHLVGAFSGKLLLTCLDDAKKHCSSDMGKLWWELYLGESTKNTMVFTVRKAARSPQPGDGSVFVTIGNESTTSSSSMSLLFQASSLLLGSLAREALLWRISEGGSKFHLHEKIPGNIEHFERIEPRGQIQGTRSHDVDHIVQRVQRAIRDWRSILSSRDSAVFPGLLDETGSVFEEVLRVYRTHRGHCPSLDAAPLKKLLLV